MTVDRLRYEASKEALPTIGTCCSKVYYTNVCEGYQTMCTYHNLEVMKRSSLLHTPSLKHFCRACPISVSLRYMWAQSMCLYPFFRATSTAGPTSAGLAPPPVLQRKGSGREKERAVGMSDLHSHLQAPLHLGYIQLQH